MAVSEYIFDAKRAAYTNINTNRIFLWIGAIPILGKRNRRPRNGSGSARPANSAEDMWGSPVAHEPKGVPLDLLAPTSSRLDAHRYRLYRVVCLQALQPLLAPETAVPGAAERCLHAAGEILIDEDLTARHIPAEPRALETSFV